MKVLTLQTNTEVGNVKTLKIEGRPVIPEVSEYRLVLSRQKKRSSTRQLIVLYEVKIRPAN